MNSKILRDLCESYQNIYDGGFKSWVNSLIEEGYDLSDYTWDEMYEAYIEEQNAFSGVKGPIQAFDTFMFGRKKADSAARARGVIPKSALAGRVSSTNDIQSLRAGQEQARKDQLAKSKSSKTQPTGSNPPATQPTTTRPATPGAGAKVAPAAAKPTTYSSTSASTADKIKGGLQVYSAQKKSGDMKSAAETGMAVNKLKYGDDFAKPKTQNPLMKDMPGQNKAELDQLRGNAAINSISQSSRAKNILSGTAKSSTANQIGKASLDRSAAATEAKPTSNVFSRSKETVKKMTSTPNPANQNISSSFEWGSSSKIVDDVADAYASIYEAKKKDQDQDGDNDFADVQIARMIASGMSKAQAIAAVKGKPYNEEYELDEGLGSAIKGLFGRKKKEEEEASKPESRGTELRKKYNVGPEKSDTSAKRQILNRSRARKERDEERYGNSVYTKKVAQQSADAHDRYLRAGYSKYGADLKHGRGNKARKRAEALQREEFEFWVNSLIEEGYDLSDYTWDEMYEIYEETAEERDARIAARRARVREMESQGRVMTSSRRTSERAKQRRQEKKDEALEKAANRALADTIGTTRRSDKPMGSEAPAPKEAAPAANRRLGRTVKRDTLASRADELLKMLQNEDFELWLEDLIEEGYDLEGWTNGEIVDLYQEIYGNVG